MFLFDLDSEMILKSITSMQKNIIHSELSILTFGGVFQRAGYIDTWGRGTLKIINACKEAELPEPQIIEKDGGIEVTIFRSNQVSNQVSNSDNDLYYEHIIKFIKENMFEAKFKPTEKSIAKFREEAELLDVSDVNVLDFCMIPRKRKEILEECLSMSNQTKNFNTNILPLLEKDLQQLTIKDKPQSQHQKYYITTKGKIVLYIYNQLNNRK